MQGTLFHRLNAGLILPATTFAVFDEGEVAPKNDISTNIGDGCAGGKCLTDDLQKIVNFFSAGVGVIVVAMIIVGGIQYITAGDNPQAVSEAKNRIKNALFALAIYALAWSFINWLIPGGVF